MKEEVFEYSINPNKQNTAIIKLGRSVLGGNEALTFTSTLHELIEKDLKNIIIDLKDVELINSSGLGMLVSGLTTVRKNNINYVLADVPDKVTKLLKMTHLDKVFDIYSDPEEALDKLV